MDTWTSLPVRDWQLPEACLGQLKGSWKGQGFHNESLLYILQPLTFYNKLRPDKVVDMFIICLSYCSHSVQRGKKEQLTAPAWWWVGCRPPQTSAPAEVACCSDLTFPEKTSPQNILFIEIKFRLAFNALPTFTCCWPQDCCGSCLTCPELPPCCCSYVV